MNRTQRRRQRAQADDPAAALAMGLAHHQAGRHDEAAAIYNGILRADPRNVDALHLAGVLLHQSGDLDSALSLLQAAVDIDPTFAAAHLNLGNALQAAGELDQAAASFEQAAALAPALAEAHYNLGNVLKQKQQNAEAAISYGRALALQPSNPMILLNLGATLTALAAHGEAVEILQRGIALAPDLPALQVSLGNALAADGRAEEALPYFEHALTLHPDFAEAAMNLGNALQALKRYEDAVRHYRKALALRPNYVEALTNLGTALHATKAFDEAEHCYRRALALQPDYTQTHVNLGNTLLELDQEQEALRCFEQAIALNAGSPEAHLGLGCALLYAGRFEEAIAALTGAMELRPDFAAAHMFLGIAYGSLGRQDQAEQWLRKAVALQDDLPPAHMFLGAALSNLSRHDEAAAQLRRAIALDPDSSAPYLRLGFLLQACGDLEGARTVYQDALGRTGEAVADLRLVTLLHSILPNRAAIDESRARILAGLDRLEAAGFALDDPFRRGGLPNFHLAYHGEDDLPLQRRIAEFYLRASPGLAWTAAHCGRPRAPGRIRVGFISKFFFAHSVGHTVAGMLRHFPREDFDITMFCAAGNQDEMHRAMAGTVDRVVRIPERMGSARALIAEQELDVLIYADIGMEPLTYFLAFSRLAPVQAVLAGHPVTTGIPNIDYWFGATVLEPPSGESHYSEKLIQFSTIPVCYDRPNTQNLPVPAAEWLGRAKRRYVCAQTLFKFHPDFDAILAGILRQDPEAELLVFDGTAKKHADLLKARLRAAAPDVCARIRWLPRLGMRDYLAVLGSCDVALDTIYFNGGNTTYQTLAAGVPLVTMPVGCMRGYSTYGCYKQMGMLDCVAYTPEEYVSLAIRLANDRPFRSEIVGKIEERVGALFGNAAGIAEMQAFLKRAVLKDAA